MELAQSCARTLTGIGPPGKAGHSDGPKGIRLFPEATKQELQIADFT